MELEYNDDLVFSLFASVVFVERWTQPCLQVSQSRRVLRSITRTRIRREHCPKHGIRSAINSDRMMIIESRLSRRCYSHWGDRISIYTWFRWVIWHHEQFENCNDSSVFYRRAEDYRSLFDDDLTCFIIFTKLANRRQHCELRRCIISRLDRPMHSISDDNFSCSEEYDTNSSVLYLAENL